MISDFLWWFDDLSWWKKAILIFKSIGLTVLIGAWLFYIPPIESRGNNDFEISHINLRMSHHDYYLRAEAHCAKLGLKITNYEAKNPHGLVNTRQYSQLHHFFSCR